MNSGGLLWSAIFEPINADVHKIENVSASGV